MSDFMTALRAGGPGRRAGLEATGARDGRDPASKASDRRQLVEHPVELRRIARLFVPHRAVLGLVVLLIVASSAIGLAQPFLVRHVIDRALPRHDHALLVGCVVAMVSVAVLNAALGVGQTLLSTRVG